MRSGFVAVVGRPNVGKSTLVNTMVGTKVSITSSRPNTTRHRVLGVLHTEEAQVVFVDTPGLHRPRTHLGARLNDTATGALREVDMILVLVDATASIGPGDRTALSHGLDQVRQSPDAPELCVVVNKVDVAGHDQIAQRLHTVHQAAVEIGGEAAADAIEYFPVSARTGDGVVALRDHIIASLREGPAFFPPDVVTDTPEALWVAELVREALLKRARDELPHSISCRVVEWEWPHIRCDIYVERQSQKGIVIGKGGEILKEVGIAVRRSLPEGAYLELRVKVEKNWQDRDEMLNRLGY